MDLIALITAAVVLALVFLTGFIGIDRARIGWNRAAAEATMRRRQLQDVADRAEQLRRSIEELTETIAGRNETYEALKHERYPDCTDGLRAVPFGLTPFVFNSYGGVGQEALAALKR